MDASKGTTESWDEWETVSELGGDSITVFPPNKHEGLQLQEPLQTPSSSTSSSSLNGEEKEEEAGVNEGVEAEDGRGRVLWSTKMVDWVVDRVGCYRRERYYGGGILVGLFVVGALGYSRMKRRSRWVRQSPEVSRLALLLREKDQKISQLLLQIAQLNEMISSPRQVPVHRIV